MSQNSNGDKDGAPKSIVVNVVVKNPTYNTYSNTINNNHSPNNAHINEAKKHPFAWASVLF